MVATSSWLLPLVKWSVSVACKELVYSWPFTFVIVTALFFFVCFAVLFFTYTWDSSRSWCTPSCDSLSSTPNWGGSRSFYSFLHSPGRVARAGVPLAVHPFF